MTLEDNFYQAVQNWKEHCKKPQVSLSSSSQPVRDCDSYRKIISMGYDALPLIRQLYDKDSFNDLELSIIQGHGLCIAVMEIVGDGFLIPKELRGNISAIEDYTRNWLDENMDKYL